MTEKKRKYLYKFAALAKLYEDDLNIPFDVIVKKYSGECVGNIELPYYI